MYTSTTRKLSCGLLVISPAGWLLAHATKTSRWDLPKGGHEAGETAIETALREAWEEVGIDFSPWKEQLVDLGRRDYLPSKDLHLFRLDLAEVLDLSKCTCHTFIQRGAERVPETDAYAWILPENIQSRIGRSLFAYFERLGLFPQQELSKGTNGQGSAQPGGKPTI